MNIKRMAAIGILIILTFFVVLHGLMLATSSGGHTG
jgi:hypothetical protein